MADIVMATKKKEIKGAMVWRNFRENAGTKSSLNIIFIASAMGWKSPIMRIPKIEALFAPIRSWMSALSFLSNQVK
jgi:hypothetical protein